ncbi:MAG: hypothetical protein R2772_11760, partial [Chitinophagales bacterium]
LSLLFGSITVVISLIRLYQIRQSLWLVVNGIKVFSSLVKIEPGNFIIANFSKGEQTAIKYTFEFKFDNVKHSFHFHSIEHLYLKLYSTHIAFIDPSDYKNCFIPIEYHIR